MDDIAWSHHTLADPAELDDQPPQFTAAEAQDWCSFVVFAPRGLPAGAEIIQSTLRREAPPGRVGESTAGRTPWSENNPSAFRVEISYGDRKLRLKQFLYDWAFPALDHPALWESATYAVPLDDRHVVWLGVDYMSRRGASARIARTTIELSIIDGEFSDDEIVALYRSLRPVDDAAAEAIADTPFAVLSYWARQPDAAAVSVPLGLWKVHQSSAARLHWRPASASAAAVAEFQLPSTLGGLTLDSTAADMGDNPVAVEVVYAADPRRNRELRLHQYRADQPARHLELEAHPGSDEQLPLAGRRVHLAWVDERYGPFDAVVADELGRPLARLLCSAGVGHDRAWFLGALTDLLGSPAVR